MVGMRPGLMLLALALPFSGCQCGIAPVDVTEPADLVVVDQSLPGACSAGATCGGANPAACTLALDCGSGYVTSVVCNRGGSDSGPVWVTFHTPLHETACTVLTNDPLPPGACAPASCHVSDADRAKSGDWSVRAADDGISWPASPDCSLGDDAVSTTIDCTLP